MKLILTGALLLCLTSCGLNSDSAIERQSSVVEYESCLRLQETKNQLLIENLVRADLDLIDELVQNMGPNSEGRIKVLEASLEACKNYRP